MTIKNREQYERSELKLTIPQLHNKKTKATTTTTKKKIKIRKKKTQ